MNLTTAPRAPSLDSIADAHRYYRVQLATAQDRGHGHGNAKTRRRKMSTSRILLIVAILTISACQTKSSENQTNDQTEGKIETDEKQQITNLLFAYRDALNASDVTKVLPLYTDDGIFMPSGIPVSHITGAFIILYNFFL